MTRGAWTRVLIMGGLVALIGVGSAGAQQRRLVLTPFAGGFIPTGRLGQVRITSQNSAPLVFQAEVNTAGALGGRAGYWVGRRWGLEASYFWASADVRLTGGPFAADADGELQGGTFKAFWQATSEGTGTDLLLSAGVMGIEHRGPAFQLASDQFDIGAVLGGGLHIEMSPLVTLRIDGDLLMYRYAFAPGLPITTQTDVLMTAGLGIRLAR